MLCRRSPSIRGERASGRGQGAYRPRGRSYATKCARSRLGRRAASAERSAEPHCSCPTGGSNAGAAYVVFGQAVVPTSVNLADIAAGSGGFKIIGETAFDNAGYSVSGAGDVNGDGFDDLSVGAPTSAGAAYVVFGQADWII
jgi:hypothetical protein